MAAAEEKNNKIKSLLTAVLSDGSRQQNGGKIWPLLTYLAFLLSALMDITYGKDHKGRLVFCVASQKHICSLPLGHKAKHVIECGGRPAYLYTS